MLIRKRFRELKVDDKIFILDPANKDIVDSTVVDVFHSSLKETTSFKFFRHLKTKSGLVEESYLKEIYEQEDQEKVFLDVLVLSKDSMVTLVIKPPVIVATTKEEIEHWMKQTGPKG